MDLSERGGMLQASGHARALAARGEWTDSSAPSSLKGVMYGQITKEECLQGTGRSYRAGADRRSEEGEHLKEAWVGGRRVSQKDHYQDQCI